MKQTTSPPAMSEDKQWPESHSTSAKNRPKSADPAGPATRRARYDGTIVDDDRASCAASTAGCVFSLMPPSSRGACWRALTSAIQRGLWQAPVAGRSGLYGREPHARRTGSAARRPLIGRVRAYAVEADLCVHGHDRAIRSANVGHAPDAGRPAGILLASQRGTQWQSEPGHSTWNSSSPELRGLVSRNYVAARLS